MSQPDGNSSVSDTGASISPDTTTTQAPADNPAWGWANDLPREFQDTVKSHLRESDRSYQELSQKYAPFKDYNPQEVQQWRGIATSINNDPKAFYEQYKNALIQNGILPAEAAAIAKAEVDDQPEEPEVDPRIAALEKQLAELRPTVDGQKQWLEKQQLEQQTAQFSKQIDDDIQTLRAKYGVFDELAVLDRVELKLAAGKNPSVIEAFDELNAYNQKILSAPRPGAGAPNVINPNNAGGIPPTNTLAKPKNSAERADMFKLMMDAAKG